MPGIAKRALSLLILGSIIGLAASLLQAVRLRRQKVSIADPADDEIELRVILDSLAFRSTATSFRGGSVLCYYGGGVLDLRGATLDPTGATLELTSIFGGGQLLVPETWRVENNVRGIFGGTGRSKPRVAPAPDAPTLRLEGLALFGGWGIASEAQEGTERWVEKMQAGRATE